MKKLSTLLILLACNIFSYAQTQYINDESFEQTGGGINAWVTQSALGFTIVNDSNPARTGTYSLNFVSLPNTQESATCIQPIVNKNCK